MFRNLVTVLCVFFLLASCHDSRSPILKDLSGKQYKEYQDFKVGVNSEVDSLFRMLAEEALVGREMRQVRNRITYLWNQSGIVQVNTVMKIGSEALESREFGIALKAFEEVIKVMPDYPEVWNKRATVFYAMGEYEKALSDINKTLQLEKRHFGALSGQANIFIQSRQYVQAREALENLKKIYPTFPELTERLQEINRRMGVKLA
jgi:tetratricopeptide (TPR) repeat protein